MFEFVFVGRTLACPWDGGGRALEHVPGTRVTANGDRIRMELGMTYPAMVSQVCVHAPFRPRARCNPVTMRPWTIARGGVSVFLVWNFYFV